MPVARPLGPGDQRRDEQLDHLGEVVEAGVRGRGRGRGRCRGRGRGRGSTWEKPRPLYLRLTLFRPGAKPTTALSASMRNVSGDARA